MLYSWLQVRAHVTAYNSLYTVKFVVLCTNHCVGATQFSEFCYAHFHYAFVVFSSMLHSTFYFRWIPYHKHRQIQLFHISVASSLTQTHTHTQTEICVEKRLRCPKVLCENAPSVSQTNTVLSTLTIFFFPFRLRLNVSIEL